MDTLKNDEITIYGDGTQKSEYIYVDDVVESFERALNKKENMHTEVIHVGRGTNNSVIDIIEALEKADRRIKREKKQKEKAKQTERVI